MSTRKLFNGLVILALLLAGSLALMSSASGILAQGPGSAGMGNPVAAQQQAENIKLVSQIGGRLSEVVIDGNFAYLAQGPRVVVLDISDSSHPTVVGQSEVLRDNVGAIVIKNDKAYVGAGNAVYIFNIVVRTLPLRVFLVQIGVSEAIALDQPPILPTYDATDLAINGDHAFLTLWRGSNWWTGKGALYVIDISDPTLPTQLGAWINPNSAMAVAVAGNYAYVGLAGTLAVIDISDPAWLQEVGHCDAVNSAVDLVIAGNHLYAASFGGAGLHIVNISDPANPHQVNSYDPRGYAYGVAVDSSYVYVTATDGGLRILNISNASEVGYYDLSDSPDGDHLEAWDVAVVGDRAYVVIEGNSLHVVDISNRTIPRRIAAYDAPVAAPTGIDVVGDYAYVTDNKRGLYILYLGNPSGPQVIGVWEDDTVDWATDVDVAGHHAYVLEGFDLRVIDITNPVTPIEVGRYQDPSGGYDHITVAGDYAYVIAYMAGLAIFDISDPTNPTKIATYDFNGRPFQVSPAIVRGTRLYATCLGVLHILDISNPAHPTELTSKEIPGHAWQLAIASHPTTGSDYVYVAEAPRETSFGGLRIMLPDLTEVGYFPIDYPEPIQVAVTGRDAYVVEKAEGGDSMIYGWRYFLRLVDIGDVHNPYEAGFIDLPGAVSNLTATDNRVYVPMWEDGLMIFRRAASASAAIPGSGGQLVSNADSTRYRFSAGTFARTTTVTHTPLVPQEIPSTGDVRGIQHAYQVSAMDDTTGQPVQPSQPYTVTIQYTDAEKGSAIEDTLALYYWNGTQWVKESTSQVDTANNTVTATPDHFSVWAVLGETNSIYLPLVMR